MKLAVVFLQTIELQLLGVKALAAIFVLVKEFFLVSNSFITFLKVAFRRSLALLDLVSSLIDITASLRIELGIVALQSIHLSLQSSLFLTTDHAAFFILNLTATHG